MTPLHPIQLHLVRTILRLKPVLSQSNLEKIIHAFNFSRLDESNSILSSPSSQALAYNYFKVVDPILPSLLNFLLCCCFNWLFV